MNNHVFRLEFLPNELIIELFQYFQTSDIFRTFYNLNFRFNYLIQSLIHLNYSTDKNDDDNHHHLSYPYIRTLIINTMITDKLHYFFNIRRLILNYVTDDLISQLNTYILPHLEYLSIDYKVHPFYMSNLREKIFSNTFPNLKSCYISRMKPSTTLLQWSQTLSLRFLKLNDIDSSIYLSILFACPNLYFLKFKLSFKSKIQSNIILHNNLKRLIINMNYDDWPWNDDILEDYFICVPNLEQFRISRSISRDSIMINNLQYYDWLFSIINTSHLGLLNRFRFDLYLNRSYELIQDDFQNISHDLKTKFYNVYRNRYDSCLIMNEINKYQFESLPNEIIIQIFDYIDIRDIFYGFYHLNTRFNNLFQPFRNLRLIISDKYYNSFDGFSSYTDTLIIQDEIYINLKSLINIRHIILYCLYDIILTQINSQTFPYLEYISISNNLLLKTNDYKYLFSNIYHYLKYCNLCGNVSYQGQQQTRSFPFLKMGGINFDVYQTILLACPNLSYLRFRMIKSDSKSMITIPFHLNLKQLIIDVEISGWPYNDQLIDKFLELVPNIEQLNIYTSNFISKIEESIINYDWLASIISNRLLLLRKFLFFFRLKWSIMSNELKHRTILQQLETNFFNLHYRYQSRFIIKLE